MLHPTLTELNGNGSLTVVQRGAFSFLSDESLTRASVTSLLAHDEIQMVRFSRNAVGA